MPTTRIKGVTREEFFSRYAKKGTIGLVGGTSAIHRAVCEAQSLVRPDRKPSLWAHAFIFSGRKADGKGRILESDIMVKPLTLKIVNGAQESSIEKYFGKKHALHCAILDLKLNDADAEKVVNKADSMVRKGMMYPVSGLVGTLFAYIFGTERWRNIWNTKNALYCSAFVQEAYGAIGMDLAPNIHTTNTGPEHLWQTKVPHDTFFLVEAID